MQRLRYYEFEELGRLLRKGVQQRKVIGKGVRVREAGVRIARQRDLERVFDILESTFAGDDFQRAEVRLRPSFVKTAHVGTLEDRRLEDDIAIWSWNRGDHDDPSLWEIKLPLIDADHRIGSLVLWKDGADKETSLSHIHAIAGQLRAAVQMKIIQLWPGVTVEARSWGGSAGSNGSGELVRALVPSDEAHRRREDIAKIPMSAAGRPDRGQSTRAS